MDGRLFEHWMTMTFDLVCLDPASTGQLRQMYFHLAFHHRFVTLYAMLAGSAAHLLALGLVPETTFVVAQQRAFKAMISSLQGSASDSRTQLNATGQLQKSHLPSLSFDDDSVMASLFLLGPEIIHPEDNHVLDKVHCLLQGARALIIERHKYNECRCPLNHPGRYVQRYKLDSPSFQCAIRTLAYTDIMACVPCVRAPLLDKRYWQDSAIQAALVGAKNLRPDNDLGYCARMLSLLGDCADVIERLYLGSMDQASFEYSRATLIDQLDDAVREIPERIDIENSIRSNSIPNYATMEMIAAHNSSIKAAICHGLANIILLLRSTDSQQLSPQVKKLSDCLFKSVSQISIDDSIVTIMLWPLWVLGCESYEDSVNPSRQQISTILEGMYQRRQMKNSEICLITLKRDIWVQPSVHDLEASDQLQSTQQSAWVRRCWDHRIRPLLA